MKQSRGRDRRKQGGRRKGEREEGKEGREGMREGRGRMEGESYPFGKHG